MKRGEKRKLIRAMTSKTPINALYGIVPPSKRKDLERFMRCYGFTPDDMELIMRNEREKATE